MAAPSLDLAGSRLDQLQRLPLLGLSAAAWNLLWIPLPSTGDCLLSCCCLLGTAKDQAAGEYVLLGIDGRIRSSAMIFIVGRS